MKLFATMESMNEPTDMIIYRNLEKFIKYRGIQTDYKFVSSEKYSSIINTFQYILIEGTENGKPVYIFLIQPRSKYEKKTDEFKKLINRLAKNKKGAEILYITEQKISSYINKKIIEYKDEDDLTIFSYTYEPFIIVLPECESSFKHEIASSDEVNDYCERLIIQPQMLPKINSTEDPQLVWIGAKRGNVIKVTGRSETAQEVVEFRLVI